MVLISCPDDLRGGIGQLSSLEWLRYGGDRTAQCSQSLGKVGGVGHHLHQVASHGGQVASRGGVVATADVTHQVSGIDNAVDDAARDLERCLDDLGHFFEKPHTPPSAFPQVQPNCDERSI
jgi:hypothetical protein